MNAERFADPKPNLVIVTGTHVGAVFPSFNVYLLAPKLGVSRPRVAEFERRVIIVWGKLGVRLQCVHEKHLAFVS
jgi:hypothetical protein